MTRSPPAFRWPISAPPPRPSRTAAEAAERSARHRTARCSTAFRSAFSFTGTAISSTPIPPSSSWTGHKTLSDFSQAGGLDTLVHRNARGERRSGARAVACASPIRPESKRRSMRASSQFPMTARPRWRSCSFRRPRMRTTAAAIKTAETELAELKSILDIAADGVLIVDRSGTVLQANDRASARFSAPNRARSPERRSSTCSRPTARASRATVSTGWRAPARRRR